MEYQMQEERKNNLTLHLLPPSPMREVHSIKLTSVVNTPVKSDAIPERVYILSRSSGSALRRTTPLRRNSSPFISPCARKSPLFHGDYSNNKRNSSSSKITSNDNTHKNNKFIVQVHGKHVNAIVDGVSNDYSNITSTNGVNEIEHNINTSENLASSNYTINNFGNKNNTNSVLTQLVLEDEPQKVDNKIETSKGSILIPFCALESIGERTPRRVHIVCQSEQISSVEELYAKRANPNLAAATSNNAIPSLWEEHLTCNDKETNHYLLHLLQAHQGTSKNEGKTPLKHKTKRATRKEPYNVMCEQNKVHNIVTNETAMSLNANCKPGLVQVEKMTVGEFQRKEFSASTSEQESNKKETRKGGKHKNSDYYMKLDCNILENEQQFELHSQQHYQQHPHECTPLHSRFVTRKIRSSSAHENKFEMKLNELREMQIQRLQLLDSQPRERSVMQTSPCASYSRHTAPSVASDHSELARPAKRNLERVSRRIFSPDSKKQKNLLEYEELGQRGEKKQTNESRKRLSYFERNQFQHRLRSSSSHTSRSADSLARHRNELPFSSNNNTRRSVSPLEEYHQEEKEETFSREELELLLMPESRENRQEVSQLKETSSKKVRGLWSFLHKQSFLPGANALVARRSAMLRSTSLQPYCNNGYNRRQPHRRGSSPALNANFDDTIQQPSEEEEQINETNEEFEQEGATEIAGINTRERENMNNRWNKANSLQYDDNKLHVSHPYIDKHQINEENNISGHGQYRMERVERTATATPTSVEVPHGPPRLSSDYNDSDDDNVNNFNDDDDNNEDDNSNNYNNSDIYNTNHYAENVKAVLQNEINRDEVVEREQLRKGTDHKNSTENTILINNKKMRLVNKNINIVNDVAISTADKKEFCDVTVTYENEGASSKSPLIDNMELELEQNSPYNNDENEWTDTPLSQKGIREASEAPTLPYTKSPSREYGSDDLSHSPYPYQNACLHNKESSEMNIRELSNSNNSDAENVAYEPDNVQISLFNEEDTVSVVE